MGGETISLTLGGARASSAVTLIIGLSALNAPFKGGVLVPAPDLLVPGLASDAGGALALAATWLAGIPSDTTVVLRDWIADPLAIKGLAASNGLAGTTP